MIRERLTFGLDRVAFYVAITAALYLFAGDVIVGAVFQRSEFNAADTRLVWFTVGAFSLGLLGTTRSRLLQNTLYALDRPRLVARIAVLRAALAAGLGALFMFPFDRWTVVGSHIVSGVGDIGLRSPPRTTCAWSTDGTPRLGIVGLALGAAVSSWVEYRLLRAALEWRIGRLPRMSSARGVVPDRRGSLRGPGGRHPGRHPGPAPPRGRARRVRPGRARLPGHHRHHEGAGGRRAGRPPSALPLVSKAMARGDRRLRTRLSEAIPGRPGPEVRLERAMQSRQEDHERLIEQFEARQVDEEQAQAALERAMEVRDDLAAKTAVARRTAEVATGQGELVRAGEAQAAATSFEAQLEAVERDVSTVADAVAAAAQARADAEAAVVAHEALLRDQLDEVRRVVRAAEEAAPSEARPEDAP